MGKKKGNKAETNGEVGEVGETVTDNASAPPPADTGKKGKKKKKDQDWEDDIAKELEDMKLEELGEKKEDEAPKKTKNDDAEDEEPLQAKSKKEKTKGKPDVEEVDNDKDKKGKKGKKNKKKGYDDDEELDNLMAELEMEYKGEKPKEPVNKEVEEEPAPKEKGKKEKTKAKPEVEEVPEEKEKKGKKGKKNRKKDYDDDEDLDKLLSEIESEYRGEKPKEEPKKQVEEPAAEPEDTGKKGKKKKNEPEPKPTPKVEPPKQQDDDQGDVAVKKKGKKNKGAQEEEEPEVEATPAQEEKTEGKKKKEKGKPNAKMLAAMKEALAKKKEEEERLQRAEEERQRQEEERIRQIEEAKRLEQEKKERKKQAEREKRERLKQEGKWLSAKQKEDQRKAKELLEHLRAQGINLPVFGEKRNAQSSKPKPKKNKKAQDEAPKTGEKEEKKSDETTAQAKKEEEVKESWDEQEEDNVRDDWDQISADEEEDISEATKASQDTDTKRSEKDDDEDDNNLEDLESEEEYHTEAERRKARTLARIAKRKADYEKKLDPSHLRAPVVCVLGHVDHGKTKILDKLRRTNVQEGEVGGITQQIGATNVPAEAIVRQTHMVKDFSMDTIKFPGLLIIDTPGHESFSNLRSRGSSLCDIAVLVVDVTQGLEPQTIESITLLKKKKTPFVVALNKVDRVFDWVSQPSKDIREIIKIQNNAAKNDFDRRTLQVIQDLNIQGLNAALFWENPDPRVYVSLVPTSAISGDGMGNLISMICNLCQKRLSKRLIFTEELQCTVLEVKTIQGHGTTIDVILINGRLREGDTIVLAGTEGPIVTQIRSLLLPKPLKEIRVKGQYDEFKEIQAAQGVKIAARDLEKAIAGLNLQVAYHEDEIELIKEEVDKEFKMAMRSIKVKERGVYVQASTLGALEALLEFFKANDVPYSGIRVGPVVKRDVMKAAAMLEHDPMYAVILAFDVKVEKDAQELADKEGVKIFTEETIYHLGDRYVEYVKDYKKKKQDEFKNVAVFPSRLKIIPTAVFNKRDPIVIGVTVEAGVLRTGTPLCVPSKEFVEIGIVTSMEFDHKNVDIAKKGVDVCIKVDPVPGHTPKLFGRHFDHEDILVSKISRESINACKDYFRDDLSKTDWKLMAELKKEFQIL